MGVTVAHVGDIVVGVQVSRTVIIIQPDTFTAHDMQRAIVEQVRAAAKDARRALMKIKVRLNAIRDTANEDLDAMTWEEARGLMEAVFRGESLDGRRYGVYVWPLERKRGNKSFRYEIQGQVINSEGRDPVGIGERTVGAKGTVTLSSSYSPASSSRIFMVDKFP